MAARTPPKKKTKPLLAPKKDAGPRVAAGGEVFTTFFAVVVSVLVGVPWLSPFIMTAPYVLHRFRNPRNQALLRRWALALLLTTAVATVFSPEHTFRSVLFGGAAPTRVDEWMHGTAGAPLGAHFMLISLVAFVAGALASEGIAGALVLAVVLAANAVYAVYLGASGYNVVQMALVGISPWQWCFLAGLYVMFAPLAVISRERVIAGMRGTASAPSRAPMAPRLRTLAIGGALVAVAFLVRVAAAGAYTALVRRWTIY